MGCRLFICIYAADFTVDHGGIQSSAVIKICINGVPLVRTSD